jgi:hypothetical protein
MCIQYTYLNWEGGEEGGELIQPEGKRGNSSLSCVEKTNMTDRIQYKLVSKPANSPITGQFLR